MRLISLKDIEIGMVLGKSIYHGNGKLLLGAGYRINHDIIDKLTGRGYSHVYIMEEGTEDVIPEDIISDEVRSHAKLKLSSNIKEIKNIADFKNLSYDKVLDLFESGYLEKIKISFDMRKIVKEILEDISFAGSKFMSTLMIKSRDAYFLDHAINTTVLAILIGSRYRFSRKELAILALGTLLHDIGKIIIEQLKDSNIMKSKTNLYKEHPTFGYLLVKNSPDISPMESQIVNQHHELQDGSGFPIGLKGQNLSPVKTVNRSQKGYIFRFAEICCVANAFDNSVINPFDKTKLTPQEALKKLIVHAESHYNRDIIETLIQIIPAYPVGAYVKIVDTADPILLGSHGVVAKINESMVNRPLIIITTNKYKKKIKPIMLDTSKMSRLELKLII